MRICFWNVGRNPVDGLLLGLCQEYDLDILILAEATLSLPHVLPTLNHGRRELYHADTSPGLSPRLTRGADTSLVYYVFDLLYLEGFDLRKVPLSERKRLLQSLPIFSCPSICYSQHVEGSGRELFEKACGLGLEGIVSKQATFSYASRRSNEWRKIKCERRQEFVIGGFTDPGGSRTGFGALLLGVYEPTGELSYVGKVGTGFNQSLLDQLRRKLDALAQSTPPLATPQRVRRLVARIG